MSFLQKAKCKIGIHKEHWRSAENRSEPCQQVSLCQAAGCYHRSYRVVHDHAPWAAKAGDPCTLVRTCRRCDDTSTRENHAYGEPAFVAGGSCDRERRCGRCGTTTSASPEHRFKYVYLRDWKPRNPEARLLHGLVGSHLGDQHPCNQASVCRRCDHIEIGQDRTRHDWSQWAIDGNRRKRICDRCDELEYKAMP